MLIQTFTEAIPSLQQRNLLCFTIDVSGDSASQRSGCSTDDDDDEEDDDDNYDDDDDDDDDN